MSYYFEFHLFIVNEHMTLLKVKGYEIVVNVTLSDDLLRFKSLFNVNNFTGNDMSCLQYFS
jgi:hypothetical protein